MHYGTAPSRSNVRRRVSTASSENMTSPRPPVWGVTRRLSQSFFASAPRFHSSPLCADLRHIYLRCDHVPRRTTRPAHLPRIKHIPGINFRVWQPAPQPSPVPVECCFENRCSTPIRAPMRASEHVGSWLLSLTANHSSPYEQA